MELWASIDLSGKEACFAAGYFPGRKILFKTSFQMRGRDSSSLLPRINECLREENLSLEDIKRWTAGTGPGNYTGLRIVSAFVSGFAFARKDIHCRGVPSAYAIASAMKLPEGGKAVVFYPLEPGRIYSFGILFKKGIFLPVEELTGIFSMEDYDGKFSGTRTAALQKDVPLLPPVISGKAVLQGEFPGDELIFLNSGSWDRSSIRDLIYVRPAVNVAPISARAEF